MQFFQPGTNERTAGRTLSRRGHGSRPGGERLHAARRPRPPRGRAGLALTADSAVDWSESLPQVHVLEPNRRCGKMWRWGLWEVTGRERGPLTNRIEPLIRSDMREIVFLCLRPRDIARRWPSVNRAAGGRSHQIPPAGPWSRPPTSGCELSHCPQQVH